VAQGDESCSHCGYALAVTDEVFGADEVLLERITDAAGVFSDRDRSRLAAALKEFESRFPQLFAVVYCGALPQQTSLRQFGFWLLNRAAVCDLEATRPNEQGALFVIDTHGRSAALVLGYFLECYLDEQDAQRVLAAGRRNFQQGLWAAGTCAALAELTARLRQRAVEAAKAPERFAPPRPPVVPSTPKFVRIREGNVPGKPVKQRRAHTPAAGGKNKGKSGGKRKR
jgi:uncharacterized membrane protein YgcG